MVRTIRRRHFWVFLMLAAMVLLCILAGRSGAAAGDTSRVISVGNSPVISDDGRYVAFASDVNNLVAGDTNNAYDIFVRDRTTGTTAQVSVNSSEIPADSSGFETLQGLAHLRPSLEHLRGRFERP